MVRTDEGVEGVGEASPEYQWTGEDEQTCVTAINTYLAPKLMGRDPRRIAQDWQDGLATFQELRKKYLLY